jgi:hypothetical protein
MSGSKQQILDLLSLVLVLLLLLTLFHETVVIVSSCACLLVENQLVTQVTQIIVR